MSPGGSPYLPPGQLLAIKPINLAEVSRFDCFFYAAFSVVLVPTLFNHMPRFIQLYSADFRENAAIILRCGGQKPILFTTSSNYFLDLAQNNS